MTFDPGECSCLTTSLRSRLSSTVLSRWAQASRSGLQEWSSSWPLNWSVTSGSRTSLQSTEQSEEHSERSGAGRLPLQEGDINPSSDSPTWLAEEVALYHFAHAAHLLAHQLHVRDALDELGQENAAQTLREAGLKPVPRLLRRLPITAAYCQN